MLKLTRGDSNEEGAHYKGDPREEINVCEIGPQAGYQRKSNTIHGFHICQAEGLWQQYRIFDPWQ